jgi:hypothetical protein
MISDQPTTVPLELTEGPYIAAFLARYARCQSCGARVTLAPDVQEQLDRMLEIDPATGQRA